MSFGVGWKHGRGVSQGKISQNAFGEPWNPVNDELGGLRPNLSPIIRVRGASWSVFDESLGHRRQTLGGLGRLLGVA